MDVSLFEKCEKCQNEEPAATTAYCPIHIDVPALSSEIEKGSFKKAYKVLDKRMPFAGIIGMICDHPCENVCVRAKLDSSISVSELERAAVYYGSEPFKKGMSVSKINGKVAIVGGGISGISAAYELDKKGFAVTIYEKSDRLGGQIWNYEGRLLDKNRIEEELKIIDKLGISVFFNREVNADTLEVLTAEYDAVFLGTGDWESELSIDAQTFQVSGMPVFAGGRLFYKNDSVIYAVSSGKRAAVSIERFIKKISLTASREREGAFETPMNFILDDAEPIERVEKSGDIYTQEEAAAEAKRCFKCRCTQCIKACSHLRKFNMTPKSYGRQIQINNNVIMGTRYANTMINSCAECGLCGEQCPIGIGMDELIHKTRESMVEKGKMPVSAHDFALKDMEFSNSEMFFMVKSPPMILEEQLEERKTERFTPAFTKYAQSLFNGENPGYEKVDYLFYPGCQLSASYPEYVEKTYEYLISRIKEGIGLMLGCCGAPADWAGRQDLMGQSTERLKNAWFEMGKPTFVLACSSCCSIFEKYLPEVPFISLWEVFELYGLPETAKNGEGHVLTVHDACATRHNQRIHQSLRSIAGKLGYEIKELKYSKEKTKCCGYGGLVWFANREQSNAFVKDRINESEEDYLVYCAMCKDLFVAGGKKTFHILDLIFGENMEELSKKTMPSLSQRHMNRARLKKALLKEMWNEDTGTEPKQMKNLIIPDEIMRKIDERFILVEDIERVIRSSKETGERFYNPEEGSYLTSLRIGDVTFWVRYMEKDGAITVLSAYSHRMEVKKD